MVKGILLLYESVYKCLEYSLGDRPISRSLPTKNNTNTETRRTYVHAPLGSETTITVYSTSDSRPEEMRHSLRSGDHFTQDMRLTNIRTIYCTALTYQHHDASNHASRDTHLKEKETRQCNKHFASSGLYFITVTVTVVTVTAVFHAKCKLQQQQQ